MGSFGERLRREREMRGITIEEIAEATKIGSRNLRALEEEKFDLLPGGIFNKGFVRAYSKFLGLDEEQAVADYLSAETSFRAGSSEEVEVPVERSSGSGSGKGLVAVVALLVVIGGGGFGGWKYYQKRAAQRAVIQEAAAQPAPVAPAPTPVSAPVDPSAQPAATTPATSEPNATAQPTSATSTSTSAPAPSSTSASSTPATTLASTSPAPETAADGFVVQIKAKQDSWVSARADGKSVLSGTLKAADAKTFHAKDRIVLTLGNVAGVQVTYNGKDLDLGSSAAGQVKKLVITAQGLQPDVPEQR